LERKEPWTVLPRGGHREIVGERELGKSEVGRGKRGFELMRRRDRIIITIIII
jgi:hypothetical protein